MEADMMIKAYKEARLACYDLKTVMQTFSDESWQRYIRERFGLEPQAYSTYAPNEVAVWLDAYVSSLFEHGIVPSVSELEDILDGSGEERPIRKIYNALQTVHPFGFANITKDPTKRSIRLLPFVSERLDLEQLDRLLQIGSAGPGSKLAMEPGVTHGAETDSDPTPKEKARGTVSSALHSPDPRHSDFLVHLLELASKPRAYVTPEGIQLYSYDSDARNYTYVFKDGVLVEGSLAKQVEHVLLSCGTDVYNSELRELMRRHATPAP